MPEQKSYTNYNANHMGNAITI